MKINENKTFNVISFYFVQIFYGIWTMCYTCTRMYIR